MFFPLGGRCLDEQTMSRIVMATRLCAITCLIARVALADAPPGYEPLGGEIQRAGFNVARIAMTKNGEAICGGRDGFSGVVAHVDPYVPIGPVILSTYDRPISDVFINSDETQVAVATSGRDVELISTETWTRIDRISAEKGGTNGVFSSDGTSLYLCDGRIRALTIEELQVTSELFPPESLYSHVAVASDDQSVLLVERSGRVEFWDHGLASRSQETPRSPRDSRCHVEAIAVNPKSGCIAIGCTDGHVDVWNEPLTECIASLALPPPRSETGDLYSLDFIDEDTLIVSSSFGRICVFDIDEQSEVWSTQLGPLGGHAVVAVSRGGEYIGIGSIWGTIAIYRRADVEQSD